MTTIYSKLAEVPFQTVKAKEKMLFLGLIDAYKRKVPHSKIRRLYGFSQNKEKLTHPRRSDDLPDTLLHRYPDWVIGTFDRDGSITRKGNNRKFRWKQKDPYLRELVLARASPKPDRNILKVSVPWVLEARDPMRLTIEIIIKELMHSLKSVRLHVLIRCLSMPILNTVVLLIWTTFENCQNMCQEEEYFIE